MAAGIVAFAGHDVASASDLGVPVRDAAIEPRREDPSGSGDRAGDRVWVATGSELVAYDLATRGVVARWALPGRERGRLRRDRAAGAGRDGRGRPVCPRRDRARRRPAARTRRTPRSRRSRWPRSAAPVTRLAAVPRRLPRGGHPRRTGPWRSWTWTRARSSGTAVVDGRHGPGGRGRRDRPPRPARGRRGPGGRGREAGRDPGRRRGDVPRRPRRRSTRTTVRLDVVTTTEERTALKAAMDAGELAGVEFQPVSTMAVADGAGVTFLDVAGRDDRDGGARGRRGRPGPGQRGRRRDAALRHARPTTRPATPRSP